MIIENIEQFQFNAKEAVLIVKQFTVHEVGPWIVLKLSNTRFGVMWYDCIELYSTHIIEFDYYKWPLAFFGNKDSTIEYILKYFIKQNEPDGSQPVPLYNIEKIKRKLIKKLST